VGRAVLRATELGCSLGEMPLAEYHLLAPQIGEDMYDAISVSTSVNRRTSYGGTAPSNLKKRLQTLKKMR
jgi:argininosuccinate lyase